MGNQSDDDGQRGGEVERRVLMHITGVDLSAAVDELRHRAEKGGLGSEMESCFSCVASTVRKAGRIDSCTAIEEAFNHGESLLLLVLTLLLALSELLLPLLTAKPKSKLLLLLQLLLGRRRARARGRGR